MSEEELAELFFLRCHLVKMTLSQQSGCFPSKIGGFDLASLAMETFAVRVLLIWENVEDSTDKLRNLLGKTTQVEFDMRGYSS